MALNLAGRERIDFGNIVLLKENDGIHVVHKATEDLLFKIEDNIDTSSGVFAFVNKELTEISGLVGGVEPDEKSVAKSGSVATWDFDLVGRLGVLLLNTPASTMNFTNLEDGRYTMRVLQNSSGSRTLSGYQVAGDPTKVIWLNGPDIKKEGSASTLLEFYFDGTILYGWQPGIGEAFDTTHASLGATPSIALSKNKGLRKFEMDANVTSFEFNGGIEGVVYEIEIIVDATGSYTFAGATGIETKGGVAFDLPSIANARHRFFVRKLDSGNYFVESNYFIE